MNRTPTEKLNEYREQIAKLHNEGYSSTAIGLKLKRDHTTIIHHLQLMGLKNPSPKLTLREVKKYEPICILKGMETKVPNVEMNVTREKINIGKSYAEYLLDARERGEKPYCLYG